MAGSLPAHGSMCKKPTLLAIRREIHPLEVSGGNNKKPLILAIAIVIRAIHLGSLKF